MCCTISCRTTSLPPRCTNARPPMSVRISSTTRSPLDCPFGRATWVASPFTTAFEPKPSRVGDIFICSGGGLRAEARPLEEHLHLLGGRVLRLVEDDERVVQGAAAHERERRDLDNAALH